VNASTLRVTGASGFRGDSVATASSTGNAGDTPAEMTPHEVDAVLAGLAEVVPQLIADYRTADAEATRWGEAAETYVENKSER
jgi:hypothetical protein